MFICAQASFTRPSDTTQYAQNDLVANSTTAGSVTPLKFNVDRVNGRGQIRRVVIAKSNASATAANFNLHLYSRAPTPTNGDNGAFAVDTSMYWIGTVACDLSSAGEAVTSVSLAKGFTITGGLQFDAEVMGAPSGTAPNTMRPDNVIYGLIETATSATYTPTSGETFKVTLEIEG